MPTLNIGKKQIEAKISFRFDRRANERYTNPKQEGVTGAEQIYQRLLDGDAGALSDFWDCATAYLKKDQPTVSEIEDELDKVIEEEGTDRLFKEAFKAIDSSGFFSKKLKNFWKNVNRLEELVDLDEEGNPKKSELIQARKAKKAMVEARNDLLK